MDWLKAHTDVLLVIAIAGTSLAFLLRRMVGEQRSEQFAQFEARSPRLGAAVTLLDGLFLGVGMIAGAVYQLVTGKAAPTLTLEKKEGDS